MVQNDFFGQHIALYYYGNSHLLLNIYRIIEEAISQNEQIIIYSDYSIYETIMDFLEKINDNFIPHIIYLSNNKYINIIKKEGTETLRDVFAKDIKLAEEKGYRGIRFLELPKYAVRKTSKSDFLYFEKNLNKALKNQNFSITCFYAIEDYLANNLFKEIIRNSLQTHTHFYYQLQVLNAENYLEKII